MKFKNLFLLLIFCFGSYSNNAQTDTLRADFIDTRIDDKVIVASCDTFNMTFVHPQKRSRS